MISVKRKKKEAKKGRSTLKWMRMKSNKPMYRKKSQLSSQFRIWIQKESMQKPTISRNRQQQQNAFAIWWEFACSCMVWCIITERSFPIHTAIHALRIKCVHVARRRAFFHEFVLIEDEQRKKLCVNRINGISYFTADGSKKCDNWILFELSSLLACVCMRAHHRTQSIIMFNGEKTKTEKATNPITIITKYDEKNEMEKEKHYFCSWSTLAAGAGCKKKTRATATSSSNVEFDKQAYDTHLVDTLLWIKI